ncbi:MAG: hypothetical protein A2277_06030 [Desulfobacterales bacterium RIFOXYA12_FULL_46_15]|nr:MAG: hypothetical protein A2277_06030 [Desulfobacterales bacterium RIFOXYA12_FULL_46_15]
MQFASRIGFFESRRIAPLKNAITRRSILVVHPPPRGIQDQVANRFHAGSTGITSLIASHPLMLVLCGHIHEQAGFTHRNGTLIVNCALNKNGCGAIIDCKEGAPIDVKMIKRK